MAKKSRGTIQRRVRRLRQDKPEVGEGDAVTRFNYWKRFCCFEGKNRGYPAYVFGDVWQLFKEAERVQDRFQQKSDEDNLQGAL